MTEINLTIPIGVYIPNSSLNFLQLMIARLNNPGMFQSFWEMDEQGVDEESEEEIQSMTTGFFYIHIYGGIQNDKHSGNDKMHGN